MTESTGTNTGTSTGANLATDMDAAAQRVRDLSEQVVAQAKKNGLTWLEGYERVLKNLLDLEEQAARGTGQDWAATLASTHANFVRETSEVFLGVMRDQLKSCPGRGRAPPPVPPGAGRGRVPAGCPSRLGRTGGHLRPWHAPMRRRTRRSRVRSCGRAAPPRPCAGAGEGTRTAAP